MLERGIIKTYLREKGFGFIGREGCPDLFFHVSECEPGAAELIQPGVAVEFSVTVDRRGRLQAASVVLQNERRN